VKLFVKKAFFLPQTRADKGGRKSIFICPADDSGPNILHATGVENPGIFITLPEGHGVYRMTGRQPI